MLVLIVATAISTIAVTAESSSSPLLRSPPHHSTVRRLQDSTIDKLQQVYQDLVQAVSDTQQTNQALEEDIAALTQSQQELTTQLTDEFIVYLKLGRSNDQVRAQQAIVQQELAAVQQEQSHLEATIQDLTATALALQEVQGALEVALNETNAVNQALNETIVNLELNLETAETEQAAFQTRLQDTYQPLREWVEASQANTTDAATTDLVQAITTNRHLTVFGDLHVSFQDFATGWDCAASDVFPTEFQSPDTDLSQPSLLAMLDFVTDVTGVVALLCLDETDYQRYLDDTFGLAQLTTNQFVQGTDTYAQAALAYMFPSSPEKEAATLPPPLSPIDWEVANYNCQQIQPFQWSS